MALDLSGAVKAPPRTTRAATKAATQRSGKLAERHEAVTGLWQLAGFGCVIFRQYADAGAIGLHSGPITDELVSLSDKNEKIARAIDYLTEAGPYAGLIVAVMPLAMQIAANHGIIKAELAGSVGVVPPQALDSQVRADMARTAQAALQQQQQAEQELAAMAQAMRDQQESEAPDGVPAGNGAPPRRGRKAGVTE